MSFNPCMALKIDNEGNFHMDLPDRIRWMQAEHPFWRIVSENVKIIHFPIEESSVVMAMGNVSVIDGEGRRIITVPASVEIDSGDFARELFEVGADLALDTLCFIPSNIDSRYWDDWRSQVGIRPKRKGEISAVEAARILAPVRSELDESQKFSGDEAQHGKEGTEEIRIESTARMLKEKPSAPQAQRFDEETPEEDLYSIPSLLKLFRALIGKDPERFKQPKDIKDPSKGENVLFAGYCASYLGKTYSSLNLEERKTIKARLEKELGLN